MPLPFTVRRTDPDAAAFCARSGASDRAALSAFVRGVKDLGLWDNMVCWPLRSTQNAGTGTKVHSLGGLGSYEGSAVGGPAWSADGIAFANVTGQYISTDYDVSPVHSSIVAVRRDEAGSSSLWGQPSNSSTNFPIFFGPTSSGTVTGLSSFSVAAGGGGNLISVSHSAVPTVSVFSQMFAAWSATSATVGFDGNSTTGNWPATLGAGVGQNNIMLGSAFGAVTAQSAKTVAMSTKFNVTLSSLQIAAFQSLYKSTLGTGLGLP